MDTGHDTDSRRDADQLGEASDRLLAAVAAMDGDAFARPCLLPGWTRAHLIGHLALNAEGLAGALWGVVSGSAVPMYASIEARDADIAALATAPPQVLRERLTAAVTGFAAAAAAATALPGGAADHRIERTPGGPTFSVRAVPDMRLREVEVHHVDLDVGYRPADWPAGFGAMLVTAMTHRWPHGRLLVVEAGDTGESWTLGGAPEDAGPTQDAESALDAGPVVVRGPVNELGWWLSGRAGSHELSSSSGVLPDVPAF